MPLGKIKGRSTVAPRCQYKEQFLNIYLFNYELYLSITPSTKLLQTHYTNMNILIAKFQTILLTFFQIQRLVENLKKLILFWFRIQCR